MEKSKQKIFDQIRREVAELVIKHPNPFYAEIGDKAFRDGNGEQWIGEVSEQAATNEDRTVRALNFTTVLLIKKFSNYGKK